MGFGIGLVASGIALIILWPGVKVLGTIFIIIGLLGTGIEIDKLRKK